MTKIPSEFQYEFVQQNACNLIKLGNDKKDGYKEKMEFLAPWLIKVEKKLTLRELSKGDVLNSLIEHFD